MSDTLRANLARCRRPVVKIGSAVLAGGGAGFAGDGRSANARSIGGGAGFAGDGRSANARSIGGQARFDHQKFSALCDDLAACAKGRALTVVSSGAVALGVERLGLASRPKEMALKQAAAAVGQSRLMRLYDDELESRGLRCAQVLLTHADISDRGRYLNARHALAELLSRSVVPVINENDVV